MQPPPGDATGCRIRQLRNSGIYFLFGRDEHDNPAVYIGQAQARRDGKGLLRRIGEPHPQIYWTEAIAVTKIDDSLGATELNYLESYFYDLALRTGRYTVKNNNRPNSGNASEEIEIDMSLFVMYTKILVGVLSHSVFEPIIPTGQSSDMESIFTYTHTWGRARGKRTIDGFAILSGSEIRPVENYIDSCPQITRSDRERYADKIDNNTTIADILFPNPTRAASFVTANSVSGNVAWRDANGHGLSEIDTAQ